VGGFIDVLDFITELILHKSRAQYDIRTTEVSTAILLMIQFFRDVTPCQWVIVYLTFHRGRSSSSSSSMF
jgi:hypothetical protein